MAYQDPHNRPRLSVNINKIALLRNSRGGNIPDLLEFAVDSERYGAEGITIHPRPDERHIKYKDAFELKEVVSTELNIEGYPGERFMKMVLEVIPAQVTLVPDPPDALTSDAGWDTVKEFSFLEKTVNDLKAKGIRTSLFMENEKAKIEAAAKLGADRIELYTGSYSKMYREDRNKAIEGYISGSKAAGELGLGINAGHDLNLENLKFFRENITGLLEVSIGHALVRDCLYYGLENTIPMYKQLLS